MASEKLVQNFTDIIFPLQFSEKRLQNDAFNAPMIKKNGKEAVVWVPDVLQAYHMKTHTAAMLGLGTEKGTIGQIYSLNDSVRRDFCIPDRRTDAELIHRGTDTSLRIRIEEVRLVLFETGIGFLSFQIAGGMENAGEMTDMNYFLSEVKSRENIIRFERRLGKEEKEEISYNLLSLVQALTGSLGDVQDFDSRPGLHYIDNKPLIFSYLLLDRFTEDFGKTFFHLRTNFKASYQTPVSQFDLTGTSGILHPFENVYWGTSLNGAVCCACMTADSTTNAFFRDTFPSNLKETYWQLYILRLHQRYAVQAFQTRFSEAALVLKREDLAAVRKAYEEIRILRDDALSFRLKSAFSEPTSVEHINDFDRFLVTNLRTAELFKSFEERLLQLNEVIATVRDRLEKNEELKNRAKTLRRDRVLYLTASLWTLIGFFELAWELAEHIAGRTIPANSLWFILPAALAVIPCIGLFFELRKSSQEMKKAKAEAQRLQNREASPW